MSSISFLQAGVLKYMLLLPQGLFLLALLPFMPRPRSCLPRCLRIAVDRSYGDKNHILITELPFTWVLLVVNLDPQLVLVNADAGQSFEIDSFVMYLRSYLN